MANVEFTRASLREAITKKYDEKADAAEKALSTLIDPNLREQKRQEWRARCESLIRGVMAQMNEAEDHGTSVSDGVFVDFSLPPYPGKADKFDVRSAERAVEQAEHERKKYLARVEAMTIDTIALTPKQLSDYFGV